MPQNMNEKNLSQARAGYERLEDVIGCKWSVSVLQAVRMGVNRPGAIEACIQGISTKVLSERLRKLTDYGLLRKQVFAEVPPRTEYSLTAFGESLTTLIERIHELDTDMRASAEKPSVEL